eukprot:CAMPEP_0170368818 /NCGR_PEP_ID=MMETSP0117_2-20130122/7655_1 /TAXON_ID=400756 /ORGANISM="Durinskia baltica, Strain CSIRO CS-38" /LENGTH=316 /DNA_ID=CAMNT_0010623501 /DNA_START=9 /DNA_END=955 /DNA_ORIENTATION=+
MDPPCGLHYSNPKEPFSFESECTKGTYLFFHPPTGPSTQTGPDGFDYGEYFLCKSRRWEMRVHMTFKRPPPPDEGLFFGVQLEEYVPMSRATQKAQKMIVAGIRQAVGGVYHSPGDDPSRVVGPLEMPHCVLPLWAFDQFIETPEGEEPPCLWDPNFSDFGQRRYKRIAKYSEEIGNLQKSFKVGPTYTFAFWGNSRFLDVLNWTVVGIPVVTPVNFNKFAGKPPVHVVLYSVKNDPEGKESRHLQSRKTYYFRAAIWSSSVRPSLARIEALTGAAAAGMDAAGFAEALRPTSFQRRFQGFLKKISCTGASRDKSA